MIFWNEDERFVRTDVIDIRDTFETIESPFSDSLSSSDSEISDSLILNRAVSSQNKLERCIGNPQKRLTNAKSSMTAEMALLASLNVKKG